MKTKTLGIITMLSLSLWTSSGNCQSYYYSGPVGGFVTANLSVNTVDFVGNSGFNVGFEGITETLTYNPVAQTLEQAGTLTLSPSTESFGIFNPVQDGGGQVGTATLTVGNNGSVSFDTISTPVPSAGEVSYGAPDIVIPVTGVGVFNGQPFSASWNIEISQIETDILAVSPTSLTFNQEPYLGDAELPDGFAVTGTEVVPGLYDGGSYDNQSTKYVGEWDINSAVATAVPEPSSLALIAFGIPAAFFLRRAKYV